MKVTFLVFNIFGMGGTVKTTLNLANFLVLNGFDVSIVSIKKTRAKSFFYINPKIQVNYLYENRSRKLTLIKRVSLKILRSFPSILFHRDEEFWPSLNILIDLRVIKFLKKLKTDILITTLPSLNILSAKYCDEKIIKIGQEHRSIKKYSPKLVLKIKNNYKKLDYLVCLTNEEKNNYKKLNIPNVTIKTIANPVFHEGDKLPRVSIKENTIISAGRLVEQKNYDTLIKAFVKVHNLHPNWNLKIYGKGKARDELDDLIRKLNAENFISLKEATDNIQEKLAEVKLFALPSHHESFGMVLVESLAVGTPVIAFASTGPKAIVRQYENGVLLDGNSIEDWESGLLHVIENPELLKSMSEHSKESVQEFSIHSIGELWVEFLLGIEKERKIDV
ncbi:MULTISPECIES: glycosyltransferase [unclassified Exiguobacterium]|uniref:glycosyltransferase n=1 Tax=unclassified Exiguobacterium TaxID=2644629 RepID=UPI001BE5C1E7|nr:MULTISPECIES: glycosyltransferase [unclassified Exiguobacterium]